MVVFLERGEVSRKTVMSFIFALIVQTIRAMKEIKQCDLRVILKEHHEMFKNLFKKTKDEEVVYAPMSGEKAALEDVPDPVFSEKMMGEGIAIIPNEGKVVAPVQGEVVHVPDTLHAVGIKSEAGTELLIHIGLETVGLKGEGFTAKVKQGDKINVGDELISFDLDYIKEHADAIITPIVWTNGQDSDKQLSPTEETKVTAGETVILTIS